MAEQETTEQFCRFDSEDHVLLRSNVDLATFLLLLLLLKQFCRFDSEDHVLLRSNVDLATFLLLLLLHSTPLHSTLTPSPLLLRLFLLFVLLYHGGREGLI